MDYEETLEYYRNKNLTSEQIRKILSEATLTENEKRALNFLLEEHINTLLGQGEQRNVKNDFDLSTIKIQKAIDELTSVTYNIQQSVRTIKNILLFFFTLFLLGVIIMFASSQP